MLYISALIGIFFALFVAYVFPKTFKPKAEDDPLYSPRQAKTCVTPFIQQRPTPQTYSCLALTSSHLDKLYFKVSPPKTKKPVVYIITLSTHNAPQTSLAIANISSGSSLSFNYSASHLLPDTDYIISLYVDTIRGVPACRRSATTISSKHNRLLNPSFESSASSPHIATRFGSESKSSPRHWTSFYNGYAQLECSQSSQQLVPRTGKCVLQIGDFTPLSTPARFHGAHQGVYVAPAQRVRISAWFRFIGDMSLQTRAIMIVSWSDTDAHIYDGFSVPLSQESPQNSWTPVCAIINAPAFAKLAFVHVFFHMDDTPHTALLIDDVAVVDAKHVNADTQNFIAGCYGDGKQVKHNISERNDSISLHPFLEDTVPVHLKADTRPLKKQLTIAVPLTANRVSRLEALSRLYGGGPVVAAVAVQNALEASIFADIWKRKIWLRRHVDVSFIRAHGELEPALFLNAVRNAAVRAATTEFVIMLDVDMTPGHDTFDCFRDKNGTYLSGFFSADHRLAAVLPVFVSDVHLRAPKDKYEVQSQVGRRVGTMYCINSQRGSKGRRWYGQETAVQTKFVPDYEPYAILRRDEYPAYDERFSGYGFNKIAWAAAAESAGWKMVVLGDRFITHLNHAENEWVRKIDIKHYLQTWRRYLSFAAEIDLVEIFDKVDTLIPRLK